MAAKKIAVVLSGCGYKDGSEITEAVSALISLGQHGAQYQCFAPDLEADATHHLDDSSLPPRNLLTESARICRGEIQKIDALKATDFDGLLLPGGFGAALHLSDWAHKGSSAQVLPQMQSLISDFYDQQKPIGAMCIAPTLVAKVLGSHGVAVTIGNDPATAKEIEKTGAQHETCEVDDYITDREHRVITTPAYMYGEAPAHKVFKGISGMVSELVEMA